MIYGLYLSATGVLTNSHRQDVIANNLANAETIGFKRDLAFFMQRRTEAQERGLSFGATNEMLENLGGGTLALPTAMDHSAGELEPTGNPSDAAIQGRGFFSVGTAQGKRLTRDGRFIVNGRGEMIMSNSLGSRVLDSTGSAITVRPGEPIAIGNDGTITQSGQLVARLGVVDVDDIAQLTKEGSGLINPHNAIVRPIETTVRSGFVERSNVDPATELTELMEAQRLLEANANMIRYQDQTLAKLVNEVGKIS